MKTIFSKEWPSASRALVLTGFFFLVVIGLKFCAYVVTIIAVSLILTLIALPALNRIRTWGIPDMVSVSILTLAAIAAVLALIWISLYSFGVLMHDLPLYQDELNQRLAHLSGTLTGYGLPAGLTPSTPDLGSLVRLILSSLMNFSDLLLSLFFIAVTTFFMMLEAPHLEERVRRLPGISQEKSVRLSTMSRSMIDFVVVRTEINMVHGILFGGALYAMGVHAAILWGVLTFVLSYIPFIGLIIAAVPAVFFAWLQFGVWGAAAVVLIVCALNLVVENPVFSYFAARKFKMPALLVILSVIFWGWLLGIAGMVFAVPLTLMALLTIQFFDDLAWINTLLGVESIFGEEMTVKLGSDA